MDMTFRELCGIIAAARHVSEDFWKQDPLYIRFSTQSGTCIVNDTAIYAVVADRVNNPTMTVDLNSDQEAVGIEFY